MRVLLVEDSADFAGSVEQAVRPIPQCELVWVGSRDSALAALSARSLFDLVLLDRRIPSSDGILDDHIDHGWRVFLYIREEHPGTPVWFLTGTEDADFAIEINNEYGRYEDFYGQSQQMYRVFWKKSLNECIRRVKEFAQGCSIVDRVAIRLSPDLLSLNSEESRTIRQFGQRYNGTAVDVTPLNGGLSDSRVLKVVVRTADNKLLMSAAAKISSVSQIREEADRYRADICRLTPGGFPQLAEKIFVGAGKVAGLFYGMVGEEVETLFHRLACGHESVREVPAAIRRIESPWYQAKRVEQVQVGQIRRKLVSDTTFWENRRQLEGIDTTKIESRTISAASCCQHADLHCANIVFDERGQAMLIDFADTGQYFSSIDPITLELSTVFHSQHTKLPAGWPTVDNMGVWITVDQFTENCQFSQFINACREWAQAEAASPEEVFASAYAYAVRQLRYTDTDKVLVRALIQACVTSLS